MRISILRLPRSAGIAAMLACLLSSACAVGPNYVKPNAEAPAAFKENLNWKQAQPKDEVIRGKWWEIFDDADLNKLEEQIAISNQTVKAAEAQFRQARALVAEARAGYFPGITANAGLSRGNTVTQGPSNNYTASLGASWEPDLWGRIRRAVESNEASAQASAADLAGALLSAQTTLAADYLDLRMADEQKRVLDDSVAAFTKSLQLTKNLYASGVDAQSDVMQAQVQLETTQAQDIDVGVARAQFEHAIAILIGKAPADFLITEKKGVPIIPAIPVSVPSLILERRPDIAGAERRVAAANAQIGVTEAAFFPDITLAASGGYQSSALSNLFSAPSRIWSIGPSLVETLFDAGLRSAQTEAAVAAYDQTVANYRQTVLGGFQEVEDNLAALRILEQEAGAEDKAVKDAKTSVTIALNQYKAGIVSYLNVVTAQTAELNNEVTAVNILKERLTAAVNLVSGLGGGWNASALNKPEVITPKTTVLSIFPAVTAPESNEPEAVAPTPASKAKP